MTYRVRIVFAAFLAAMFLFSTPLAAAPEDKGETPAPKIDINAAGVEELMELPGIGRAYAERIVAHREKTGPFQKVEEIMNVRGIGEKTFLRIRDRIRVGKGTR